MLRRLRYHHPSSQSAAPDMPLCFFGGALLVLETRHASTSKNHSVCSVGSVVCRERRVALSVRFWGIVAPLIPSTLLSAVRGLWRLLSCVWSVDFGPCGACHSQNLAACCRWRFDVWFLVLAAPMFTRTAPLVVCGTWCVVCSVRCVWCVVIWSRRARHSKNRATHRSCGAC